jgi:hypothetical protein
VLRGCVVRFCLSFSLKEGLPVLRGCVVRCVGPHEPRSARSRGGPEALLW